MTRLRVVAGAVRDDEGRLLVARRPEGHRHAGLWELPGGKVEPGESDAEALRRELDEELGIEVIVGDRIGECDYDYPDLALRLVGLHARLRGGAPRAQEHQEVAWVRLSDLGTLDWCPPDIPLIERLVGPLPGGPGRGAVPHTDPQV